mgnify:FL=1
MLVPGHILFAEELMLTAGVTLLTIVIEILLLVTVAGVAQLALEVSVHEIISPFKSALSL